MRGIVSALQILAVLGALGGVAGYIISAEKAKSDRTELREARAQDQKVIGILGRAAKLARARAETHRQHNEELAHVVDDNTCSSPAIDGAFDILRRHRAGN